MSVQSVTTESEPRPMNIVWGISEIAKIARVTPRRAHYLVTTGQLHGVGKVGERYFANVDKLQAQFGV